MKKLKTGKFVLQIIITAVLGAVILSVVNGIIGMITPTVGAFGGFLTAIVSVIFFVGAMKINPGKEEFLTTLPIIILSIAIVDLLRNWISVIPEIVIPFTFIGLAFGLGSVFLATMIIKKYIIK